MKKVVILPDAGLENPFQYQLIELLTKNGFRVNTASSKCLFPIIRAIRKYQPDVLYFDWLQSFFLSRSLLVTLIRSLLFILEILYVQYICRVPIFHTLHNLQNHAGIWISIETQINRFFLPRCRYIRVYSETTKNKILALYAVKPQQIVVIQDVPFHHYYLNTVSQTIAREYFDIPQNSFVYGFIGSIKPYKGLESLIKSFKSIASPNDYLLIGGAEDTPAYTYQLQSLIQQHPQILFIPKFIADTDIQYYMNAADVMVLPFRNVEHSGSVDLCMSFKKPIITLNTPFLGSLLAHQTALLFQSPEALDHAMVLAKTIDLMETAHENFQKADTTNYQEIVKLFASVSKKEVRDESKVTVY